MMKKIKKIGFWLLVLFLLILICLPGIWIFVSAFRPNQEILSKPANWIPDRWTIYQFTQMFSINGYVSVPAFKYLMNSADLKPDGRMVKCANCNHQWFQGPDKNETFSSVPSTTKIEQENNKEKSVDENKDNNSINPVVKNLPSTVVRQEKPSIKNSIIVIILVFIIFSVFWISRSYGTNTLVLIEFYIREFFFNLNLIIADLAKIIHNILN